MAGQKISVDLMFKANTQAAKKNINDLSQSLFKIANMQFDPKISDKTILQASKSAQELSRHLNAAFNVDTGKMDLVKFNQSLQSSQQTVQQLAFNLVQAGQDGAQAFVQLSKAIANSETPMVKTNNLLNKMWTSLKNVATWQISSSLLNALTSSISEAYHFTRDLNESLTDIRIVTGYSADEMERFAAKATKAAKVLSTTTNEYAKASLIYFQQGLNDKEVQERTDLTIKMANVTGQSVSEVSDQLTAVWNNFDDGTETLEHYVDVMVALGAATASSSEEISEGLNKFAAVAETVGLSYEYAAAALATVTATTRESADVVGTAFKTLFARIQDLELGETLDDGTTLGQYSQALAAVGINIKDVNGDIKDMDVILEEMGARWNTLTKDQQVALAQNVAGVRQYTQLVALMDNWGYFQENLNASLNSSGALQEQSEIYAEGWEAARDRVAASMEQLYQDILDDDFFIGFLNSIADVIDEIDHMIDSLGGIGVVVSNLGAIFLNVFSNKISTAIQGTITQLQLASSKGMQKYVENTTSGINQVARDKIASGEITGAEKQSLEYDIETNELKAKFMGKSGSMTDIEKEAAERQLEDIRKQQNQHLELLKVVEQLTQQRDKELQTLEEQIAAQKVLVSMEKERLEVERARQQAKDIEANEAAYEKEQKMLTQTIEKLERRKQELAKAGVSTDDDEVYQRYLEDQERLEANIAARERNRQRLMDGTKNPRTNKGYTSADALERAQTLKTGSTSQQLDQEEKKRKSLLELYKKQRLEQAQHTKEILSTATSVEQLDAEFKKVEQDSDWLEQDITLDADMAQLLGKTEGETIKVKDLRAELQKLGQSDGVDQIDSDMQRLTSSTEKAQREMLETSQQAEQVGQRVKDAAGNFDPQHFTTGLEKITQGVATVATIVTSITSLVNVFKSLGDESLTAGEKVTGVIMGVISIIPSLISGVMSLAASGLLLSAAFWWVTIIVAALAGLAILIAHIIDNTAKETTAVEKATEALEAHTKALEAANEQLTEATQHLDDMRSLLKDISTTQDAFKMLVEGSTAWQENLEKNNEQILQLLELYPELANMFVNGEKLIDFQNGVYTVTDVGALVQYVEGNAKVAKDTAELAAIFAAWDKEVAAAEVDLEEKKQSRLENQRQLAEKFAQQMSSTISNAYNGRDTAKLTIGEHSIQRTNDLSAGIWMGQMQALATTIARDVVSTGISVEDKVNELRNTVGNEYSFVNEADWEFLATSIESISDSAEGVNLVAEAEENLAKARETIPAQLKVVANSILSTRKGYAQLSDAQKELATEIYAQQLVQNKEKNTITAASSTAELTQADMDKLARAVLGIDKSAVDASSDKWRDNRDAKGNKNVQTGDWGDYFSNTDEGAKVLDTYMQKVYQKGFDKAGAEFSAEGVTLGDNDGTTISFQAVIEWANAKAAIEELPTEELFAKVEAYSDEIAAAYTGNILDLTQEQVDALSASLEGVDFDKYNPLTMTPEELEGFTDSYAGEIMRLAADLGKMPAEILAVVQEQLLSYDAELAELRAIQRDIEAGNAFLAQSAEQFGLNASALETYTALLQEMYGTSYQQAAKAAVMNARYTKGIENLGKALADADESLIEWRDTGELTYETAESLNEIINALYDVFGVKVSTKFIDEYYDKLQILLKGGEEAVEVMQELELAAAKDYVASLYLKEDSEKAFNDILTQLQSKENDFEITGSVNLQDEGMLDTLNGMIASGEATAEQIQAAFEAIGWAPNFEVVTHTLPPQDTYTYTSTAAGGNNDDPTDLDYGKGGGEWTKVTTVSTVQGIGLNEKATIDYIGGRSGTTVSSGGGGGFSSKSKPKKQNKEQYYQERKAIDELQRALDKLSKAKDRAFGANRITAIEAEIIKLGEMQRAQENYTTAIKEQLLVDQKAINQLGFSTDANGIIKNYDEIVNQAWARYEAAVATGNDAVIETAKNQYDELIEATEQYNEALELFKNEQDKLLELQYELQDLALEKITYEVEYKIELNKDDLKYLEWQLEKLNDPIYDAVEAIRLLGQTLQENLDNMDIYKQGITDVFASAGLTEADIENVLSGKDLSSLDKAVFTEDQVETIREYRDALYECYEALDAFYDQIMEQVNEAFEKMNEEAEETISKIEHLGSMLSSYQNIVDIVGAKALSMTKASLQALSKAQVESSKATLEALQTQLDTNRSALESLQAARKEAEKREDTEAVEKWDEQIKIVQQTISDLEESVNDAWGNALQAAAEDFQLAVELATQSFEEAMSGIYGSFEKMQEAYDQQKEISQRYVSNYQKIYELSKLNRDLNKSITETDSVKGKQALMELQREINDLQESGVDLSEHDLEFLQKKYELRQAEIALEEAQNAKSQVRMQRDAEGNWGYVYTADANKTAEAEQGYEDKLYETQQLEQDYLDKMEAAAIQAQINMVDAINNIRREDFESEAAYMEEVNRVREYYTGLYKYYIDESNKALSNSATIYNEDWLAYSEKTGYKIVANQTWRDQFNETFLAQTNGYKTVEDAMVVFEQKTSTMCTNLAGAYQTLEANLNGIFQTMGYTLESFGADDGPLMTTVKNVSTELDTITTALSGWQTAVEGNFQGIVKAADGQYEIFKDKVAEYRKELDNLIAKANDALQRIAAAKSAGSELSGGIHFKEPEGGPAEQPTDTGFYGYIINDQVISGYENAGAAAEAAKKAGANSVVAVDPASKGKSSQAVMLIGDAELIAKDKNSYATGGYTGSWGSEGRLAVLHQKELVLNAADTENFLSAINIVRDISRAIDLRVAAQQGGLSAISKAPIANTTTSTLQQEVTIHAEFPNATQRTEIEAAFDTLLNRASQFANRKM